MLQVAGEKRWIVHEPSSRRPLRSQPWTERRAEVERTVAATEPILDVVLRPGDALYLPRGFIHAAEAQGDVCAHLTVGMHVVTRHALVEALAALAVDDVELRRSLPLGLDLGDRATLADELRATVAALVAYAEETESEPVVEHLRESLASTARPAPIAPLAQVAAARSVDAAMSVRLREGLAARLDAGDGFARLEHRSGALVLDASVTAALETLLDGGVHTVGTLPGEAGEVEELVRTLLRESVLVPVGG